MSAERRTEADRHDTSFRESALRDERKKNDTSADNKRRETDRRRARVVVVYADGATR
jgi:hypothetical protein